jgi:hydroxyacylglutathione hydrolase
MLDVLPIPAFDDNYIWLIINRDNHQAAVVDPGDPTPVMEYCDQNNITLCDILITHHHNDHVGGVTKLAEHYNIPVYGPASESIPCMEHALKENDEIALKSLGNLKLSVIDIPGHTSGHIAYVGNGWVFCGDTLFAGGCGRIFEGTPPQMYESLNKLKALDPETLVFCAHEYTLANLNFAKSVEPNNPDLIARISEDEQTRAADKPTLPTNIGKERKTNPFLRADSQEIIDSALGYRKQSALEPVEVFATIREMKDNF